MRSDASEESDPLSVDTICCSPLAALKMRKARRMRKIRNTRRIRSTVGSSATAEPRFSTRMPPKEINTMKKSNLFQPSRK
jgi:hypothetical protein